jgi:hypothetical protein
MSQIEILLSEYVLQALVINVNLALSSNNVVPPNLQCMNHYCELKIVSRIIQLVLPQLSRCRGYNVTFLHKYKTQTLSRCITIDIKAILQIWHH